VVPDERTAGPRFDAFCREYIIQTKGRWGGKPLILEDWQRDFWWEALEFDPATGLRIYSEVGLGLPRKNGKSMQAAAAAHYFLSADGEPEPEVYVAAAARGQAGIVLGQSRRIGFDIVSQVLWDKGVWPLSRGWYHWQHEPCWVVRKQKARVPFHGSRDQSTIWQAPSPKRASEEEAHDHPTRRPCARTRQSRDRTRDGRTGTPDKPARPQTGQATRCSRRDDRSRSCAPTSPPAPPPPPPVISASRRRRCASTSRGCIGEPGV